MIFNLNVLEQLVDLKDVSLDDLVHRLTFSGFEVENVQKGVKINNLTIGKVLSCEDHPDSDHLHILKVDTGTYLGVLDIVCGAKNVRKDAKVLLACVGCKLPNGLEIQESTIRGARSCGMCCSLKELNIDDSSFDDEIQNGIFICPLDAPVGSKDPLKELNLNNTYLDINVLPNRPDCFSYYGIALEIGALLNRKVLFDLDTTPIKLKKSNYKVELLTDKCPSFAFLEIRIKKAVSETPAFLKDKLQALNVKSISPLVDIGNYLLKIVGTPCHCYDLDKVKSNNIVVSTDFKGNFKALNEKEYSLEENDIVIKFGDNVECLGGVMGGFSSQIDTNITHLGLEVAAFFHQNVRLTSKRLNLISDSSTAYTKKVNPYLYAVSMNFFLKLLNEVYGEENVELVSYQKASTLDTNTKYIKFDLNKLNKSLGSSYSKEEISNVLASYNIKETPKGLVSPLFRQDLVEQCDINEEIFRYYEAKNINLSLNDLPLTSGGLNESQKKVNSVINTLVDRGLDNIQSFTLISKEMHELVYVFENNTPYIIKNPMTKDHEYVRTDLLSSMLETISYNKNRKNSQLGLFEVSNVDIKDSGSRTYLSIGLYNFVQNRELLEKKVFDFYHLKGYFEDVMGIYHIDTIRYKLVPSKNSFFHKGISADVLINNKLVGTFGLVSPLHSEYKGVFLLELDLTSLSEVKSKKLQMSQISSFPKVERDFSFVVSKDINYSQIKDVIKKAGGKNISSIYLFDYYQLSETEVSLGIKVEFLSLVKTFTDEEVKTLYNKIIEECEKKLKIKLRG